MKIFRREWISKTLGFVFNSESVAAEKRQPLMQWLPSTAVSSQQVQDPADVLPKFLENLNAAGADKARSLRNRASWMHGWQSRQAG